MYTWPKCKINYLNCEASTALICSQIWLLRFGPVFIGMIVLYRQTTYLPFAMQLKTSIFKWNILYCSASDYTALCLTILPYVWLYCPVSELVVNNLLYIIYGENFLWHWYYVFIKKSIISVVIYHLSFEMPVSSQDHCGTSCSGCVISILPDLF